MKLAPSNTIANLIDFHYQEYPLSDPPTLDRLESGDWSLTRTSTDGNVTFIEIIDGDTGEFISTAVDKREVKRIIENIPRVQQEMYDAIVLKDDNIIY